MRLVLQCAVCGTVHPVGASVCGTCAATGLQNLRLMFECLACFRLGIAPACEACNPKPRPPPFEVVPDPADPAGLARSWGVDEKPGYEVVEPFAAAALPDESPSDEFELTLDPDDRGPSPSDSGFDLLLDDDLPLMDPDKGPEPRG